MSFIISQSSAGIRIVLGIIVILWYGQQAHAQITANASCETVTNSEEYVVKFRNLPAGTYRVWIDNALDTTIIATLLADSSYSTSQAFLDGTKTLAVRLIDITVPLTPDTTDFVVHEALCIDADGDDVFDFNKATCDYTMPLPTNGVIVSTVAPYNTSNVYLYVLADSNGVVQSAAQNYKGHFTGLENGVYQVHAYNFLDTAEANQFLDSLTVGVTDLDGFNVSSPACYNWCGSASYTVDCECLINIDADPVDVTVCPESDGEFFVVTSIGPPLPDGAALEYQWQEDSGSGFTNVADTDSILNLTNIAFADSGNMYRVIITLDVGGTDICLDTSVAATLHVYPDPVLASDLDNMVCSDEPGGIILAVAAGSVAADSFDIVSITVPAGLTADAGNASTGRTAQANVLASDMFTNQTGFPDTVFYDVAPISGTDCVGDTTTVLLIVQPEPLFTSNLDDVACSAEPVGVVLPSKDDNGLTIDSFYVSLSIPGTLSAGTANSGPTKDTLFIASDNYSNLTDDVDTVIYTVAPFSDGCLGDSIIIKVAIKPEPVFAVNMSGVACSDSDIGVLLPLTDDSGLNISSFDIDTVYVGPGLVPVKSTTGGNMTTIDTIAGDMYTNTGLAVDSVIYSVIPYGDGCAGDTFSIVVTITPEPVGSDPTPVVCSDEALSINLHDLITNGSSVDSFFWQAADNANVDGETLTTSNDTIITDVLTNTTTTDQVVVYTVTPKSGDCIGDPFTVTVTVTPEPVVASFDLMVCSDELSGILLPDSSDNDLDIDSFTITAVVGSNLVGIATQGTGMTALDTLAGDSFTNNASAENDSVIYTVTPFSGGCEGDPFTITLIVKPEPVLNSPALDVTVCSQSATGVTMAVTATSIAATSYNIVAIDSSTINSAGGSPGTGITSDAAEISDDIWVNTSGSPVVVTYYVSPISAEGCVGDTATIQVTVNPEVLVDAGTKSGPVCSNMDSIMFVDFDIIPAIGGGASEGSWSTSGDGTFNGGGVFTTSTAYIFGANDITNGTVTLTLTSDDPAGPCPSVIDTVVIAINDVECATFPWNGVDERE